METFGKLFLLQHLVTLSLLEAYLRLVRVDFRFLSDNSGVADSETVEKVHHDHDDQEYES